MIFHGIARRRRGKTAREAQNHTKGKESTGGGGGGMKGGGRVFSPL